MLRYALTFFVLALLAALLGYGGVARGASDILKLVFGGLLIVSLTCTFLGTRSRRHLP